MGGDEELLHENKMILRRLQVKSFRAGRTKVCGGGESGRQTVTDFVGPAGVHDSEGWAVIQLLRGGGGG